MDKRSIRKALSALLTFIMVMTSVPFAFAEGEDKSEETEEKYKPGEVIVMFEDDAVKDSSDSLRKARDIPSVSSDFGLSLMASGSEEEAACDARSEADVIGEILGDDFVLEDSLVFADSDAEEKSGLGLDSEDEGGISVALVSSDRYDTEEMIEKLGKSDKVAAAEPNYYVHPADISDYSANDTYNKYLYQLNSPKAQNKGGESVADRGTDPEKALSVNAASVWSKETSEDETVVAVLDTGVLDTHEDLQGSMWENPGNIGLKGEHGYNFYDNNEDPGFDDIGHGTHCAGVIAAQMNNGTGTAGVAGNRNIKIMALKFMGNHQPATLYQAYGAFSYALKAKQMGVNVAATSNSWSGEGEETTIYDAIIDKLGEAGIISFIASGNYSMDIDRQTLIPSTSDSEYTVVVGAADITGKPAPFSDFGKNTVDLYAPGENILSTVGYDSYLPSIYTAEELTRTTEYYGEFSENTVIEDGAVTPEKGERAGETVKQFGKSQFRKQPSFMHQEGDEIPDDARLELSIDSGGRYFSPDHPCRLKFTIKNAQYGEQYYLYFPYEKNPLTTGDEDTKFSIVYESTAGEEGGSATVMGGEVYEEDGELMLYGGGIYGYGIDETEDSVMTHCNNYLNEELEEEEEPEDPDGEEYPDYSDRIMSYEEADGRPVGIGLQVMHDLSWKKGESHDLTLYIDSIGVSDPEAKIESTSAYEVASGTSMACPAAAGAGALLASLDPMKEGEDGAEYVRRLKSRLFSCVTVTDELKDLCSTGGYLDLSKIDEKKPAVSDAVCDADKGTITLKGENLSGCTVSYKRLKVEGAEETALPSGGMDVSFSEDGKSIVISGAKDLMGTYTAFTVTDGSGRKSESKFFLVRGQNKFKKIAEKRGMSVETRDPYPYYVSLVTDKDGKDLYGYDMNSGVVAKFNGKYFDEIQTTKLEYNAIDWLEEQGDKYSVFNDIYQIETFYTENLGHGPLQDNGKLYQMANVTMEDGSTRRFFAVLDLSKEPLKWEFSEFAGFPDYLVDPTGHINGDYTALDGKVYYTGNLTVGEDEPNVFACYDIEKNEWKRLADLPDNTTRQPQLYAAYGKVYYMFGHDVTLPIGLLAEGLVNHVWCYDTEKDEWEKKDDIPFIGKFGDWDGYAMHFERAALAENGLVFPNTSVDGAGNCFLYNTETNKCEPMYRTVTESISDTMMYQSCAATREGIYYIRFVEDELMSGYDLYFLSAEEGAYRSRFAKLSSDEASLKAGKELELKVISGKANSWKSSNKKVCTVRNGKVTALKKGTAVITAVLTSGQQVTCKVKVTTSPKLSKKTIKVKKGKTKTVKITGKAKSVKNRYTNSSKAKIISKKNAEKIKVKGLKKGKTTLKIKVNGKVLRLKVTVI